jgi:hypothetical protein
MQVTFTGLFKKRLKRLSQSDAEDTIQAIGTFIDTPNAKSLNFEKLRNRQGYFTIRSNYKVRILLRQTAADAFDVVAVGSHDYVYEQFFR